jgi:hypothetical protein
VPARRGAVRGKKTRRVPRGRVYVAQGSAPSLTSLSASCFFVFPALLLLHCTVWHVRYPRPLTIPFSKMIV